jgi:hypothetical protein
VWRTAGFQLGVADGYPPGASWLGDGLQLVDGGGVYAGVEIGTEEAFLQAEAEAGVGQEVIKALVAHHVSLQAEFLTLVTRTEREVIAPTEGVDQGDRSGIALPGSGEQVFRLVFVEAEVIVPSFWSIS